MDEGVLCLSLLGDVIWKRIQRTLMHRGASRKAQGPALPQSHPLSLQVEPDGRIVGRAGQARGLRLAPRPPLVPHELCQPNRAMRSAFPRDPRRTGTRRCPYMELIQRELEYRYKDPSRTGTRRCPYSSAPLGRRAFPGDWSRTSTRPNTFQISDHLALSS